jgi:hypothetical protein
MFCCSSNLLILRQNLGRWCGRGNSNLYQAFDFIKARSDEFPERDSKAHQKTSGILTAKLHLLSRDEQRRHASVDEHPETSRFRWAAAWSRPPNKVISCANAMGHKV